MDKYVPGNERPGYSHIGEEHMDLPPDDQLRSYAHQLKLCREQYDFLVENHPEIIMRWDNKSHMTYANAAFFERANIPAQQFLGKSLGDMGYADEVVISYRNGLKNVFDTGEVVDHYNSFPGADSSALFYARMIPEKSATGAVESVLVIARAIDLPQKQNLHGIELKDGLFAGVADLLPAIMSIVELPSRKILYSNRDSLVSLGLNADELVSMEYENRLRLFHPNDRPAIEAFYDRFSSLMDRQENKVEYRIKNKWGEWVNLAVKAKIFQRDEAGNPLQAVMIAHDITSTKKAEEEIFRLNIEIAKNVQDKYHSIFNSIDDGLCIFELIFNDDGKAIDYRFLEVNAAFERQTGLKDILGKTGREIFIGDDKNWLEVYEEVVRSGKPNHFEKYHEGTGRWYRVYVNRIGAPGSKLLTTVFDDISERKMNEQRQAFLLKLNETLRSLNNATSIQEQAARILGEQLGCDRVIYCSVEQEEGQYYHIISKEYYTRCPLPGMVGRHAQFAYGRSVYAGLERGEMVIVSNIDDLANLKPEEIRLYESLKVRAFIIVPLVKDGRYLAALAVNCVTTRHWTEEEIDLVKNTAEQTWSAVERANAEEALRISEEKYRSLFNSIDEGFCIIEILYSKSGEAYDYRFIEVNEAYQRHTGQQDPSGKLGSEVAPATESFWLEQYDRVARTGVSIRFEAHHEPSKRWYESYASKMGDASSRQVAIVFTNISQRKEAEAALRESEEQNRALINHTSVGIIRANLAGNITFLNEKALLLFGFLPNEGIGLNLIDITVEEYRPMVEEKLKNLANENKSFESEKKVIRKDGSTFWANVSVAGIKDGDNKVKSVVAVVVDITKRKEAEQALLESEALLASVFKVSPVGLGFTDAYGKFVLLNDEMQRFLPSGKITAENQLKSRWEAYTDDGNAIDPSDFPNARALRGDGNSPALEMIYAGDNGKKIWTRVASIPLKNNQGNIIGAVSVVTDIDELKRTTVALQHSERQLKRLLRLRDEFIGIASHELKTPITSMKAYTEMVQERLEARSDFPDIELVSRLNSQIDRLTILVNHLLDTTRISEGQLVLSFEYFDINELLIERVEEIKVTTAHRFELDLQGSGSVFADRERIGQVVTNLLSNATKYSPKDSRVKVSSRLDNNGITVSVQDDGYGIPELDIKKIFERFFRVTVKNRASFPGMGLGLYISSQIIQNHGGTMLVQSKEEQGSIFSFTLPFKQ